MLRTALRPRWLALLLVALLLASGMGWLGHWQLDRAREHGRRPVERAERAQARAVPRPVEQVIAPQQTFPKDGVNVRVVATGHWEPAHRLLVTDRTLGHRTGYWVLVPLRLADGTSLPVVRGWVASRTDPAAAGPTTRTTPTRAGNGTGAGTSATTGTGTTGTGATAGSNGTVQVVGFLQPTEPPETLAPGQGDGLPADELSRISATDLVNRWTGPLIAGFVVEQSQTPVTGPAPQLVPPPIADAGLDLLNVFYALQWWLFAAIVLFLWGRLVRDDHLGLMPGQGEQTGQSEQLMDGAEPAAGTDLMVDGAEPAGGVARVDALDRGAAVAVDVPNLTGRAGEHT